ncbi:MAG: type II toxin-antitoxin system RelB/DinJ family antitoxin [Campylobacterales bacterium]|nr:type II toxin-antitoxin system RelB/DinJ family antitoxin [Campylobacterales bacterium]
MALDGTVRARIDNKLKDDVEKILKEIGLSTSQAINLFMHRIKQENGIPFELKIPNDATRKAIEETKNLDGEVSTMEEFLEESKKNA